MANFSRPGSIDFSIDTFNSGSDLLLVPVIGGNVGIGTNNPLDKLTIVGNVNASGCYELAKGTKLGGTCGSGRAYKTNEQEFQVDWNKFMGVKIKTYNWINDTIVIGRENIGVLNPLTNKIEMVEVDERLQLGKGEQLGFIYEDVLPYYPERTNNENGIPKVIYDLNWMFENRKAIQELKTENDLLKEDLCSLGIARWC